MLTLDEIREYTGENGLSFLQAEESRKRHGTNVMTPPERTPLWKQYPEKFRQPHHQDPALCCRGLRGCLGS